MLPIFGRCAPSKSFQSFNTRNIVSSAKDAVINIPKLDGSIDLHSTVAKSNLEGGVKVVSYDLPVPQSTISVFVKAGTRYETPQTSHSTAFLKHLAYRGTNEKSAIRLVRDIEHIGASLKAEVSRDTLSYHAKGLRITRDPSLDIIAETIRFVLNPLLLEHEVESIRNIVRKEATTTRDYREKVLDILHSESFRESGLANPLVINPARVEDVTPLEIHSHVKNFFFPGDRITIVGTGIDHQFLLDKVSPLFTNPQLKGKYRELAGLTLPPEEPTPQNSSFVGAGGMIRLAEPSDTHLGLAFPGVSFASADRLALQVLANALRSSENGLQAALSKYSWVKSLEVSSLNYEDAGLLVVYVNAESGHGRELTDVVYDEIRKFSSKLNQGEVDNAKKRVKLDILKDSASCRYNLVKHLANTGSAPDIASVDAADLSKVSNVLNTNPVLAALGDIRGIGVSKTQK